MTDILTTSMEQDSPATPTHSLAGDSEPEPDPDSVFKIPGLGLSSLPSSLSSYFAPTAKTRISRGEQFSVKARRLVLTGDIAYLIEWESSQHQESAS